jgi:hypothetical protein
LKREVRVAYDLEDSILSGPLMTIDESLKNATTGVALVGEILKAAGENPNVKEAGQHLGKAGLTIAKTINNALLPLAAVNFAFDKARKYFAEKFEEDISVKASKIPPEDLIEPKASIAGPTLQGLAFTHEEENLKDMYLSLLATAMDGRVTSNAHPAFVEIIKQLNSEEANLIKGVLKSSTPLPIAEIRLSTPNNNGWNPLSKHLLNILNDQTQLPEINERLAAMVDNWVRLGLVEVDYTTHMMSENSYAWVKERPEVERLKSIHEKDGRTLMFTNGIMTRTALGIQFAKSVGLA